MNAQMSYVFTMQSTLIWLTMEIKITGLQHYVTIGSAQLQLLARVSFLMLQVGESVGQLDPKSLSIMEES